MTPRPRIAALRALSFVLLASLPLSARADFDRLYVFGDSLSDVGNIQTVTSGVGGIVPPTPGPYYFDGRFSNGPNFVETLAQGLGLGPVRPSVLGGDDYAYGGALVTGTPPPVGLILKDVDDQVTQYLAGHPVGSPTALYLVYAGSNDLVTDPASGPAAAASLAASIGRLYDAGARSILAPNLPPLGLVPRNNGDPARAAAANGASAQFNAALDAALDGLEARHPDLTLYRVDVAGLFADIAANPAAFGLTNVADAAAPGLEPGARSHDTTRIAPGADQYLFWDDLHPTRAGHALLGRAALAAVPEPWALAPVVLGVVALMRRRAAYRGPGIQ
jgi:phospholipase/lecithinase/hemolysin